MGVIRPPAVAGTFYPDDQEVLRRTVAAPGRHDRLAGRSGRRHLTQRLGL